MEDGDASGGTGAHSEAQETLFQARKPDVPSLAHLVQPFRSGGQGSARDFAPVADIDLVRTVRAVKAAETLYILLEPADFLLRRKLAGVVGPRRMPPDD